MYSGYPDEYSCINCGEYVFAGPAAAPVRLGPLDVEEPRRTPRSRRKSPTAA
jgi:hypothetical protein